MSGDEPITKDSGGTPYLCECSRKRRDWIRDEIVRRRLRTVEEVYAALLDGGGCRTCASDVDRILREAWGEDSGATRPVQS